MAFDYKKEYKEFYMPKNKPSIVTVPSMNYIAVRGTGNPNQEDGEYKQSIGLLYGIAFTVKMSKKGDHRIEGYFDYVVPPLEGFWWMEGVSGIAPEAAFRPPELEEPYERTLRTGGYKEPSALSFISFFDLAILVIVLFLVALVIFSVT